MIDELSMPDIAWYLSNNMYYTSILASSGEHQDNEKTGVLSGNFFFVEMLMMLMIVWGLTNISQL